MHHVPCMSNLLTFFLGEQHCYQLLFGFTQQLSYGLIQGILVLEEPTSDVVSDCAGIVVQLKVGLVFGILIGLGFTEVLGFAQVVLVQHGLKGLVGGFREHTLFLKDGQDTHGLKFKVNHLFNNLIN